MRSDSTYPGVLKLALCAAVGLHVLLTACHPLPPVEGESGRPPGDGVLRVGIIGDQTYSPDLDASYLILEKGIRRLNQRDLDVVLHTGDLIESSAPVGEVRARFAEAAGLLDRLRAPWFMTAGDHDVNPPEFKQDSSDRSREALFQELYGQRVRAVLEHPYYSFDIRRAHFIALYSQDTLHATPRFGNIFLSRISDRQFEWLRKDLEAHRNAEAIVVFLHQPLWYNWSGWQRVHELLANYSVTAVVSGHFHYNQDGGVLDGISYFTVGATGGVIKQGSRNAGSVHHVSVLTLQPGRKPRLELVSVSDDEPLALAQRLDMDRVQAIDVVLGELFGFDQRNPVFLRNGELVSSCDGGAPPARVAITSIGNPVDLPLDVEIRFSEDSGNVELSSPGFSPGQCKEVVGDMECVLARSARIFFSNLSGVSVKSSGDPLWATGLRVKGSAPPPGTALHFDVRLAYDHGDGEIFLERRATTTVSPCP